MVNHGSVDKFHIGSEIISPDELGSWLDSLEGSLNSPASIAGKYISVWAYINGQWKSYDPDQPFFSDWTTMTPGGGYWIKTSEACTWSLP